MWRVIVLGAIIIGMRFILNVFVLVFLAGCAGARWVTPADFEYMPILAGQYEIATWQKITDYSADAPIYIYIEGDGHAFNAGGRPTTNPTPRGTLVRDMVARDTHANVAYIARPCQYIMSDTCNRHDWTDGRFSPAIIDAMATAIKTVAASHPVVLVGYSGGAMVSGLVIKTHPEIVVRRWVTIGGVLNHAAWTAYFGDNPLTQSMDMSALPDVPQTHYIGGRDTVVPPELAREWARAGDIIIAPNATHGDFGDILIE